MGESKSSGGSEGALEKALEEAWERVRELESSGGSERVMDGLNEHWRE